MDQAHHQMSDLFCQLGLPDEPAAIAEFIRCHRPLPAGMLLCDAPFWSDSQARFLREAIANDADWAEVVDALSAGLNG